MLRFIRLLFRKFTPVETAVLNSVVEALPADASVICERQIAAITKVQRILDWTEINFYRIVRGKPDWTGVPQFSNRDEFTLAKTSYDIGGKRFKTRIICVAGHIFALVTRPSIKSACFGPVVNLQATIVTDPSKLPADDSSGRQWPASFLKWHADTPSQSNGWDVLSPEQTYVVHLTSTDFVILAVRNGDEFLMSRKDDSEESIYHSTGGDSVTRLAGSFGEAIANA